jgi:hypothetical protein
MELHKDTIGALELLGADCPDQYSITFQPNHTACPLIVLTEDQCDELNKWAQESGKAAEYREIQADH